MKNLIIFSSLLIFGILFITSNNSTAGSDRIDSKIADSSQVCIVSGEEFPMNGGVKYQYLNKEVSFCCEGCIKSFKKEPANFIKDGLHCPVCDESDAKKDLSHTHDGVKYYFCGSGRNHYRT
jgi:YHS domain-containing protein